MPKSQALDPLSTTSYGGQAIRLAKTFVQVGKPNEFFFGNNFISFLHFLIYEMGKK